MSGTAGTFTCSTGTVNFNAAGAQSIAPFAYTFNNVTLSGSGAKTLSNATINGILSMEGTATTLLTVTTYGASATLQYKGTGAQTTGTEFPATWSGSGGVIIANTSGNAVTLNAAKVINAPLTINLNATLNTSAANNYAVTFGGNFVNNGTFTANGSAITIGGTGTQSIDGFTTTGDVIMTKTGGTATFDGNVNGGALTLSGLGGTLNLGTGLTHTFTGAWTRTNGILDGGSSTLKIGGSVSGSTGTFTASTGTVEWNAAGAQTIAGVTYNNLTLSGSGAKTTTGATVNGILSMEGTATTTGTVATYGASATLQYKGSAAQTTGTELAATIPNLTINNAAGVNMNSSATVSGTLTLTSGNFAVGANTLTLNGPAIAGTPANLTTTSSSSLVFGGSASSVLIPTSVSALNNLTINNASGVTLQSSPTLSGTLTLASGNFAVGANTLTLNGPAIAGTPANLTTTSSSSLTFGGSASGVSVPSSVTALSTLTIGNSSGVALNASVTISGDLTINSGTLDLASYTANRPSGGGTLTVANGATLKIGGTGPLPLNYDTHSIGATSTIEYSGTAQSVATLNSSQNYGNLTLSGSNTKTLGGNIGVAGACTVNSGVTLACGATTSGFNYVTNSGIFIASSASISIAGDWDGTAGTFSNNSGKVVLNGTNTQTVSTGGAWDAAATNNNWKNNWYELKVTNTNGVNFADGFEAAYFTCTNANASLCFAWQEFVTNVFEITASGGLNLQGGASGQEVKLRRYGGSGTDQWEICPSCADQVWIVSCVDVQDSVNSTTNPISPDSSIQPGGNNRNWFVPTLVTLEWFEAIGRNGAVTARWKTAAELNNAGFNVYRSLSPTGPWVNVNGDPIWGLGTSSRGSEYKFLDQGVVNGTTYYYTLESVEFDGRSEWFGPVEAHPGVDSDGDGMTDDWEIFYGLNPADDGDASDDPDGDGILNSAEFLADTNPKLAEGSGGGGWGGGPPSPPESGTSGIYKMTVRADGVYRLTRDYLRDTGGITNLSEWTMDNIRVYNEGQEIPLHVHNEDGPGFDANDTVDFYGTKMNTRFTDENVYWLAFATNAAGLRMAEVAGPAGGSAVTNGFYLAHHEKNEFYRDELPDESPDDDHWFFSDYLYAPKDPPPPATVTLTPVLTDVCGVETVAVVAVAFRAVNYTTPHHVRIKLNGVDLPDGYWSGAGEYVYATVTTQSVLSNGTNVVAVTLPGDTGAAVEQVLINWVEIGYTRNLHAADESATFTAFSSDTNLYTVSGYTNAGAQIFRIVDSTDVSVITNAEIQGTGPYAATFSDSAPVGTLYAAVGPVAFRTPASIVQDAPSNLYGATNGADYIVIVYDGFHDAIQPLASHRAAEGMRVKVVKLQDVYDDFNFGIASPYAIRDFLAFARDYWVKPAPVYVLLVGDGSYDYKDNEGLGTVNYMPAKMVHDSESVEAPSDNWYVSLDSSEDFLPDMHIGRLPARTAQEVTTMVNKIVAYEAADPSEAWARTALFVSDNESQFEAMNDSARQVVPADYLTNTIYVSDYPEPLACKTDVVSGINSGALLVQYSGHGSVEYWAAEKVLQTSDVAGLTNGVRLPLVVTPTCYNGYFAYPAGDDFESLAETLVRKADGGAIACFSPSGLSAPPAQKAVVDGLFEAVFDEGTFRLGAAVTRAKAKAFAQLGEGSRNVAQIFMLFGDPALKLKQWPGYAPDATRPAIVEVSPTNGAVNAARTTDIRITFGEAMDEIMAQAALSIEPFIDGSFRWEGATLVFQPSAPLPEFTTYTVRVLSNACDLAGNTLTSRYEFVFTAVGSLSGTLSFSGDQAGMLRVLVASAGVDLATDTNAVASVDLSGPGPYVCSGVPIGTYRVWAFDDANDNGKWDPLETAGEHASSPVGITPTAHSGIDISLSTQDSDGDGLKDWVETNLYHTDPLLADTDGDGMPDGAEAIAGTSATNPASLFRIDATETADAGTLRLSCETVAGRWYVLQVAEDLLNAPGWGDADERAGTGGVIVFTNTTASATGYFRLKVRLQE